ncbi:esterase ovca2 [Anaeramoeba ignava]|uniref:Esterase ovca2 n=1 Tax=Anaeramoeba ignava TaxID=1746090 RepID=A0A9Q0RF33_ANAIG|nr:esterase ovca2 [Anaeramoeba ignava]
MQKKSRFLCLHGYGQNSTAFSFVLRPIQKALKDSCEFIFLNGTNQLTNENENQLTNENQNQLTNENQNQLTNENENQLTNENENEKRNRNQIGYSWWIGKNDTNDINRMKNLIMQEYQEIRGYKSRNPKYSQIIQKNEKIDKNKDPSFLNKNIKGVENSLEYIHDFYNKKGPFYGIIGFSQGAAMSTIFTMKYNRSLDFKLMILSGNFILNSIRNSDLMKLTQKNNILFPSLHIIGKKDLVVPPKIQLRAAEIFQNKSIFYHDGGHLLPRDQNFIDYVVNFIKMNIRKKI